MCCVTNNNKRNTNFLKIKEKDSFVDNVYRILIVIIKENIFDLIT